MAKRKTTTVMKAADARKLAEKNAPIVAKQQREFKARQAAQKKAKERAERKVWRETFERDVRANIRYAVEDGETEILKPIYVGDSRTTYSSFKVYEQLFEYKSDMKLVIRHLKKDGYEAKLGTHSYKVDDRVAYINSGGECGSERVYWTTDVVLKVSW
jgi:hypothetical protein